MSLTARIRSFQVRACSPWSDTISAYTLLTLADPTAFNDNDDSCSRASSTSRTDRSRNSFGYFLGAGICPPSRGIRASIKPGTLHWWPYDTGPTRAPTQRSSRRALHLPLRGRARCQLHPRRSAPPPRRAGHAPPAWSGRATSCVTRAFARCRVKPCPAGTPNGDLIFERGLAVHCGPGLTDDARDAMHDAITDFVESR